MAEILDNLRIFIENVILTMGYPGLAGIIFIENIFAPIPSEVVLPFAGFLVSSGKFTFTGILIASTLGAVIGAVALYYIGLWADEPIVRGFTRKYGKFLGVSEKDIDRAMHFFDRFGNPVIFFGRLIPLVRSLISLPAGMNRMSLGSFLAFTTMGTLIWNILLGGAGYYLGENWELVLDIVDKYEKVWLALMAAVIIGFFGYRIFFRKKDNGESTEINPTESPSE